MARLTMRQFRCYLEQMNDIRQDEWLMALNISTNPHLESDAQKRLWDNLRPPKAPTKEMDDDKRARGAEVVERMKARKKSGI